MPGYPSLSGSGKSKVMLFATLFIALVLFGQTSIAQETAFPSPDGKRIDGTVLRWDAVEGAGGYNIYGNSTDEESGFFGNRLVYLDTVSTNEYELEFSGKYVVIAFNEDGTLFSPWLIDGFPDFIIEYVAPDVPDTESVGAQLLAELGCGVNELVITTETGWRCLGLEELRSLLSPVFVTQ